MTAKRDGKSKPKKAERPKVKKEKLSDLDAKDGEKVKAGDIVRTYNCSL